MSKIFISHSSANNAEALAVRDWLNSEGWGPDDIFLDIDPIAGIHPGERWITALHQAVDRCQAVVFLVSKPWLQSDWCQKELDEAHKLNKVLFGVIVDTAVKIDQIPKRLTGYWQQVDLAGGRDGEMWTSTSPNMEETFHGSFSASGKQRLRLGLKNAGLDPTDFEWPPPDEPDRTPYRGFRALEVRDAGIFFGRDADVVRGMDTIRGYQATGNSGLIAIVGASGAGKSSFMGAGLIARMRRDDHRFLTLPPIRPAYGAMTGRLSLLTALEAVLSSAPVNQPLQRAGLRKLLEGPPDRFRVFVHDLLSTVQRKVQAPAPPTLVITIDQGEELLFVDEGALNSTLEVQNKRLLNLLAHLCRPAEHMYSEEEPTRPQVIALMTIRADAVDTLLMNGILAAIRKITLPLAPMNAGNFERVVNGPAEVLHRQDRKLELQPDFVGALLDDVARNGGADKLPLLAFIMQRMYTDYGSDGVITLDEYKDSGRLSGAINHVVSLAIDDLRQSGGAGSEAEAMGWIHQALIPKLVVVDVDTLQPVATPAELIDFSGNGRKAVEALVGRRLLTTLTDQDGNPNVVQIAHEALLRQWRPLLTWLEVDREAITDILRVNREATDWEFNGRRNDLLKLLGGALEQTTARVKSSRFSALVDETVAAYITSCQTKAEDTRRARSKQLQDARRAARSSRWALLAATVLVAVVSLGLVVVDKQLTDTKAALHEAQVKDSQLLVTKAQKLLAEMRATQAALVALEALPTGDSSGNHPSTFVSTMVWIRDVFTGQIALSEKPFIPATSRTLGDALALAIPAIGEPIRHEGTVRTAAFSPDNKRIVTASTDKTARIWDANTGTAIGEPMRHEGTVRTAAFSPDNKRIVTASADNTARIWDANTGTAIGEPMRHKDEINRAAFSPDNKRIVTASADNIARIWDANTGTAIGEPMRHEGTVWTATFSPDGKRIVTASDDKTARIWDANTGTAIGEPMRHESRVWTAVFSPDDKRIVTASADKTARIWDANTGTAIGEPMRHKNEINRAAFSPDNKRIVTASDDNTARIWDANTGTAIGEPMRHESRVWTATFSPDDKRIVTASDDNTARIWDANTGTAIGEPMRHKDEINRAAFSPDNKRIVTASDDNTARIWDANTGTAIGEPMRHESRVWTAVFSPDDKRIVTASADKTARIWDANTGTAIGDPMRHESRVWTATFSPDNKRIVTASDDNAARIWDANTGTAIGEPMRHEGTVWTATFSPDNKRIVTASDDNTARIWDANTGTAIGEPMRHKDEINRAVFSPDNKRIVTASADNTARIWDANTGTAIGEPMRHEGTVWTATFSPDDKRIVTASADKTARIWDANTGTAIGEPMRHEGTVRTAAFSPDNKRIVTASDDNTARIWDANTGTAIGEPMRHESRVWTAVFSHDDKRIVTASADNTARIWDAPSDIHDLVIKARNKIKRCLTAAERKSIGLNAIYEIHSNPDYCRMTSSPSN